MMFEVVGIWILRIVFLVGFLILCAVILAMGLISHDQKKKEQQEKNK